MVSLSEMACPFTVRHQMITVVTKEKILNEIPLKNGPAEFECFTQSFGLWDCTRNLSDLKPKIPNKK